MITNILTIADVRLFFKQLITEGVGFHPDDNFKDIINFRTQQPFYNSIEAEKRNILMDKCFQFCNKEGLDVYEVCLEITEKETGLGNLTPVPSTT